MNLDPQKKCVFLFRAQHIAESMKKCPKDGKDIHDADDIRHGAELLADLIKYEGKPDEELQRVLLSLERRTLAFFKKRFGATYR